MIKIQSCEIRNQIRNGAKIPSLRSKKDIIFGDKEGRQNMGDKRKELNLMSPGFGEKSKQ